MIYIKKIFKMGIIMQTLPLSTSNNKKISNSGNDSASPPLKKIKFKQLSQDDSILYSTSSNISPFHYIRDKSQAKDKDNSDFHPWTVEKRNQNIFPIPHEKIKITEEKEDIYSWVQGLEGKIIIGHPTSHSEIYNAPIITAGEAKYTRKPYNFDKVQNNAMFLAPQKSEDNKKKFDEILPYHPTIFNNQSGHYRPNRENFLKLAKKLYVKGLLYSHTIIEIKKKSYLSDGTTTKEKDKIFEPAYKILNMPLQDWHYSPFREKLCD